MLPEFSCNLLDALPLPPWQEEINWDLHITRKWETRTPFSLYVKRVTSTTNDLEENSAAFAHFTSLPAEVQLRILGLCSASTLFHLMHVSSALRTEASKLFWANTAVFFLVDASWLLDGGYFGYQCYDPSFLQNVQNIEVEYEPSTNSDICQRTTQGNRMRQDQVTLFWDTLRRRFPNAKNVVINQNGESGIWRSDKIVPEPLQFLLQACPSALQSSALVLERHNSPTNHPSTTALPRKIWERSSYQWTTPQTLERLESRRWETVLLPAKPQTGLVGDFERLRRRCFLLETQQYALWPLAIEALDRYHFDCGRDKPFSCPFPGCRGYFKTAGTWTIHAAEMHYQHSTQFSILPDEIRVLFEKRARTLEDGNREAKTQFNTIRKNWSGASQSTKTEIERNWKAQIEDDMVLNAAGNAGKDKLWEDFVQWASPMWDCY